MAVWRSAATVMLFLPLATGSTANAQYGASSRLHGARTSRLRVKDPDALTAEVTAPANMLDAPSQCTLRPESMIEIRRLKA
eukprot:130454-Amorphochlora_amoeboformis.AAC.1